MTSDRTESLATYIRAELLNVPLEHWSQFFPVQLAVWRFLEKSHPGTLQLTRAGFDQGGPYFVGRGANWFYDVLWDDVAVDLAAKILEPVVLHLKSLPSHPLDAVTESKLPGLDVVSCDSLAELTSQRLHTFWK